jgi:hypothetical protein
MLERGAQHAFGFNRQRRVGADACHAHQCIRQPHRRFAIADIRLDALAIRLDDRLQPRARGGLSANRLRPGSRSSRAGLRIAKPEPGITVDRPRRQDSEEPAQDDESVAHDSSYHLNATPPPATRHASKSGNCSTKMTAPSSVLPDTSWCSTKPCSAVRRQTRQAQAAKGRRQPLRVCHVWTNELRRCGAFQLHRHHRIHCILCLNHAHLP